MRPAIQEINSSHNPETLIDRLGEHCGAVLLRSAPSDDAQARYSFVAARPFLVFRSWGSRCEISHPQNVPATSETATQFLPGVQYGNPWQLLDSLMARYELLEELDLPFPLGGCFGFWGYDSKNFVEPKLPRRAINDLELPDCHVGFYDSLVVFDHRLGKKWIVSTGITADGSRSERQLQGQLEYWRTQLSTEPGVLQHRHRLGKAKVRANFTRSEFIARVKIAQDYIRAGDIYQVNVAQRLAAEVAGSGWELFQSLSQVSPAPFSAFVDCGDFQLASSSPELFLRLSGSQIRTRPIKGTRPRSADANRDAQLTYELQTSSKEMAELVMITDLLRNDLGKVCDFGSVQVPELVRLERYAQVQHLVSTIEGRLRPEVTHFAAFASCFPGGSITGAPKFRAMAIIDELEPIARGPYTGALGYLGFNRESQLSIIIRTAIQKGSEAYFNVGAGIVADSSPEAEYEETLAKAQGFFEALQLESTVLTGAGHSRQDVERRAL